MSSTTASAGAGDSSGTETAGPVLQVKGLRKSYETDRDIPVRALRGLDLTVSRGEFVAVCGPSGCGKSTLLNVIAGLEVPDEGTARIGDDEVTGRSEARITPRTLPAAHGASGHQTVGLEVLLAPEASVLFRSSLNCSACCSRRWLSRFGVSPNTAAPTRPSWLVPRLKMSPERGDGGDLLRPG